MLRSKQFISAAILTALLPLAAHAANQFIVIKDGNFTALHDPAVPDGQCFDPPGLHFTVAIHSFFGELESFRSDIEIQDGAGDASGCAYFEPTSAGVIAEFDGSFTWDTADGQLNGRFELYDFPTETEGVFAAFFFIEFDGGTGKFQGAEGVAIAFGYDLPFGGLGEDGTSAGVVAEAVVGLLKVKK